MRPMTHLQLLQSGLVVVAVVAIHAWLDPDTPLEMGWALALVFCFAMASWFLLLLVMPGARKADSRWQAPVSAAAGGRIMDATFGTWIVLTTLLFIAYEGVAFGAAPWLGIAGAIAFVAGMAIAHRFVRRGVRHPLMPYAISATCVGWVFITVVRLHVGPLPTPMP